MAGDKESGLEVIATMELIGIGSWVESHLSTICRCEKLNSGETETSTKWDTCMILNVHPCVCVGTYAYRILRGNYSPAIRQYRNLWRFYYTRNSK